MVAKCENKNLIKSAAQFFDSNKGLTQIFVSEDGQYFYQAGQASPHLKRKGVKLFKITREQLETPKPKAAPKTTKKPE